MENSTKFVYSTLHDIFKNIWEQQKYSEAKNGILLTLNIAIFAVIVRVYFHINNIINANNLNKTIFYFLLLVFLLHIFFILQSFFPKYSNKEEVKLSINKINIFFFGDIQKLQSTKYLDLVLEKLKVDESTINKALLLDLSNQIVKLSEITQIKYISFKKAFVRMYSLGFLFILFFTYLYYESRIESFING